MLSEILQLCINTTCGQASSKWGHIPLQSNEDQHIMFHNFNSLWPSDAIQQHKSMSTLYQVMACCLMAPGHYLNQYCILISEVPGHSSESNFKAPVQTTILYNEFEKYAFKIPATSPRGQWVKSVMLICLKFHHTVQCSQLSPISLQQTPHILPMMVRYGEWFCECKLIHIPLQSL